MDINLTGPRIKQRRTELKITQVELAEMLGVTHPTIQRYETGGIKNLKRDTIANLAKALNCSPLWLMGYEDKELKAEEDLIANVMLDNNAVKMLEKYMSLSAENKNAVNLLVDALSNAGNIQVREQRG